MEFVSFSKKNLIIIGVAILLLILTIFLTFGGSKKTKTTTVVSTNNKDFDTKTEELSPTSTPKPTSTPIPTTKAKPTNTPIPTLTPMPTNTPFPTSTPKPILKPTRRPTKIPTSTPTPDTSIYATGVVLDVTDLVLLVGESYQIQTRVEPSNTTNQMIYWSSNNGNIALVTSDGWVVGQSLGEAVLTASTINNKTTLVKVKVVESKITPTPTTYIKTTTPTPTAVPYPTRIDLSLARLILQVGETKQLYVKYQPENIVNKTVTWSTSDSSVLTISTSGLAKGIKVGTATVKVVSANNLSGTATVVVSN